MVTGYYFSDEQDNFKVRHYVGLLLLLVLLAWKLLRGISPDPVTWYVYVGFLLLLAFASALTVLKSRFRLRTYDMSVAVAIFCAFAILRTIVFGNYRDTFTAACLVFFGYFFLATFLRRVSDRAFFKSIAFLFTGLALIEIFGVIEYFYEWGIIDYQGMEEIEGVAPIEGVYAGQNFLLFFLDLEVLEPIFGRLSGVAGTPYASAGLMSAIAAFGLASKRWVLAALASVALLLNSTGSAVVALYVSAFILYRKNIANYIVLAAAVPFLIWVLSMKGISVDTILNVYLTGDIDASMSHMFVASLIGEGRHSSSFQTEIRFVGTLLSLGVVGIGCVLAMVDGWLRGLEISKRPQTQREYRAASYFMLCLLLSTLHYPALFIYPNICFVVAFVALISSRLRLVRVAGSVGTKKMGVV